jgi:hypothetical protein
VNERLRPSSTTIFRDVVMTTVSNYLPVDMRNGDVRYRNLQSHDTSATWAAWVQSTRVIENKTSYSDNDNSHLPKMESWTRSCRWHCGLDDGYEK